MGCSQTVCEVPDSETPSTADVVQVFEAWQASAGGSLVGAVQGGFIWLFYGPKSLPEEERPPIPYVPELDDPTWQPVYGSIEFECNHW